MALINLFPPIISTYMPAFIKTEGCRIYFSLSSFNSEKDIANVQVIVRSQNTNLSALNPTNYPSEIKIAKLEVDNTISSDSKYYITLLPEDMKNNQFQSNVFYKVQLRFTDIEAPAITDSKGIAVWLIENEQHFSEWSTVCLIKGISKPALTIEGLDNDGSTAILDEETFSVVGKLSFEDENEQELFKSYRIKLYQDDVLIEDTGNIYTNNFNTSEINYNLKSLLLSDCKYKLFIDYLTYNNYSKTEKFLFRVKEIQPSGNIEGSITATPDIDNGYIIIKTFIKTAKNWNQQIVIRRANHKDNFTKWEDLHFVQLSEYITENSSYSWNDNTIESGVWYKYSIQTIDTNQERSDMIKTETPVMILLDDSYLVGDNGKQMIMKFNPQVASIKNVVSESIIQTLGSKYPFVKRNGDIRYSQFSISGMISAQADEIKDFLSEEEAYGEMETTFKQYNQEARINQQNDFIFEKIFRDKIIDFIDNGEVRLYRSTPEGNILVKLTDINFTPEQTLGRMIYSFSATATEIAEATIENYNIYDIITTDLQRAIYEFYISAESVDENTLVISEDEIDDNNLLILNYKITGYEKI